ncbi:MAG: hypothetical protein QY316_00710 [Thermodesulfobacteriota bacterium]|nr:MAG: hypothetical protein QY316_00710 [Thermodesulfobacteriota bacterium]
MSEKFLGHELYQELHDLIGATATKSVVGKFKGQCLYFPIPESPIELLESKGRNKSPNWRREGAFRHSDVRELVLKLRASGMAFIDIAVAVKKAFPNEPEKHVSKSAAHRFWLSAKAGELKEFGIDGVL